MKMPIAGVLSALLISASWPVHAQAQDPFQWLEAPRDPAALAWAERETTRTQAEIGAMPDRDAIAAELQTLLAAGDPPPQFALLGPVVLKFQKSAGRPHGVLSVTRRLEDGGLGAWREVLDVGALRESEGVPFELQFSGLAESCLPPEYDRCILRLSPAGADDVELREFDLTEGRFVDGGYRTAAGRAFVAWMDRDRLLIEHTLEGAPTLPTGWPASVAIWTRGTPLAQAQVVWNAEPTDAIVQIGAVGLGPTRVGVIARAIDYSTVETILVRPDGTIERTSLPRSQKFGSSVGSSLSGRFIAQIGAEAVVNGRVIPADSVVSYDSSAAIPEADRLKLVFAPGEEGFLSNPYGGIAEGVSTVRMVLDRRGVQRIVIARLNGADWSLEDQAAEPVGTSVIFAASDPASDAAIMLRSGYLLPSTMSLVEKRAQPVSLFEETPAFDAEPFAVELKTARSKDGTEIDYFLVRPKNPAHPGVTPTLMTGYGAFGITFVPGYLDYSVGGRSMALWLNRGGAFVLPLIRGGGERGEAWHQAAIRERRQNSYDDFAAVTQALIDDGFTTPAHIGVFGSSNGGLLAAVMGTQRPELYGAIVSDVPLTDLIRMPLMGMGAAWTNEYGDPKDPAMLAVLSRYSPYQVVTPGRDYPPFLITIATSDNRVGPGHARKLAARLMEVGATTYFLEDQEGGHGVSDPLTNPSLMADRMTFFIDTLK